MLARAWAPRTLAPRAPFPWAASPTPRKPPAPPARRATASAREAAPPPPTPAPRVMCARAHRPLQPPAPWDPTALRAPQLAYPVPRAPFLRAALVTRRPLHAALAVRATASPLVARPALQIRARRATFARRKTPRAQRRLCAPRATFAPPRPARGPQTPAPWALPALAARHTRRPPRVEGAARASASRRQATRPLQTRAPRATTATPCLPIECRTHAVRATTAPRARGRSSSTPARWAPGRLALSTLPARLPALLALLAAA